MSRAEYIARWLAGRETGRKRSVGPFVAISRHVRNWVISLRGERCWQCGWAEIHPVTGRVPVHVDHIDGNFLNTTPENLRLLCPNCHSLTTTYGALNMGRGRMAQFKSVGLSAEADSVAYS